MNNVGILERIQTTGFLTSTYSGSKIANGDFWFSRPEETGLKKVLKTLKMKIRKVKIYPILDILKSGVSDDIFIFLKNQN